MSYTKWDWSVESGSGLPRGFEPVRRSPQRRHETDAGYFETEPKYTRDTWLFRVEWGHIYPQCYIWLVNFWHAHRGGQLFHFTWPVGLYGLPPEFDTADPGGVSPWSSEIEPGYGEAMWHLCRFVGDDFGVRRIDSAIDNLWNTTGAIEIEQV